ELRRCLASVWHLCREDSQRREARRSAGAAADQVRLSDQPQGSKSTWPGHSVDGNRPRRRGDRVIRRRNFITLLGSAAAACPFVARAQKPLPVIGFLYFGWPDKNLVATFHKGLNETGYFEGRNLGIEFRSAQNDTARLPKLAADLVRHQVAAIAAPSGTAALAARAATKTIPIVFNTAGDPVQMGLVSSINRPGGNVTGVANMHMEVAAKRFG